MNSLIGISTTLKGDFEINENLRIDGKFEGNITGSSSILIGKNAVVEFNLTAKDIIIGGHVKGNIILTGKAIILSSGYLEGSITASSIEIQPGGIILGKCKIKKMLEEKNYV